MRVVKNLPIFNFKLWWNCQQPVDHAHVFFCLPSRKSKLWKPKPETKTFIQINVVILEKNKVPSTTYFLGYFFLCLPTEKYSKVTTKYLFFSRQLAWIVETTSTMGKLLVPGCTKLLSFSILSFSKRKCGRIRIYCGKLW